VNTVGVTATRHGMTAEQLKTFARLLVELGAVELHHGDCLGGDDDADQVAAALGVRRVSHPPTNPVLRAYCRAEVELPPEPYHDRNRAIVRASCPLIGVPREAAEQKHGGTWGTIAYARQCRRPVIVVNPCGDFYGFHTHGMYAGL